MNADLLLQFLNDPAWDAPFFKRLAHNDTGQASGHQGGVVVPKDLRVYFPALDEGLASANAPTVDRYLTRSAESRLTDNLGLRSKNTERWT